MRSKYALFFFLCIVSVSYGQKPSAAQKGKQTAIRDQFPITKMWDEALAAAKRSGRPALIFNVDYVDSASIAFRDNVLRDEQVRDYLNRNFELGVNDFSVDPPPSVGFDSLRNLGLRLDGLEKGYLIAVRPTAILIRPDSSEIDRITNPERLTPKEFIAKLKDYMAGKNTLIAYRDAFWRDTTNMQLRIAYLEKLVERSWYDSTIRHLAVVARDERYMSLAKESRKRLAEMRFGVERNPKYLIDWMTTLDVKNEEDSLYMLDAYYEVIGHWQRRKTADSIYVWYNKLFLFTNERDPDLLNNCAWDLLTSSYKYIDTALALVNEAISKKDTEPNYYDTKALAYFKQNKLHEAVEQAKLALKYARHDDNKYFQDKLLFYERELEYDLENAPDNQKR